MVENVKIIEPKEISAYDFEATTKLPGLSHKELVEGIGIHFYKTEHSEETLYKYFISFANDNGDVFALRHISKINLPPYAYLFSKDELGFGLVKSSGGKNIYVFYFETIAEEEKLMARARGKIEADIELGILVLGKPQHQPSFKISAGDGAW